MKFKFCSRNGVNYVALKAETVNEAETLQNIAVSKSFSTFDATKDALCVCVDNLFAQVHLYPEYDETVFCATPLPEVASDASEDTKSETDAGAGDGAGGASEDDGKGVDGADSAAKP